MVPAARIPKQLWEVELYDLASDPGETTNLAALNPDVVTELAAHMDQAHAPYEAF